jgi:hypothetical protein
MLQARRSRVRFLMRSLNSLNLPNPSSGTMTLGSTQPITEMSTRNLRGGKDRRARKSDNFTAICERADCLENVKASTSHNSVGLHGLLQGQFTFFIIMANQA